MSDAARDQRDDQQPEFERIVVFWHREDGRQMCREVPWADAVKAGAIGLNSGWHGPEHPCSTEPCSECIADAERTLWAAVERMEPQP